MRWVVLSMLEPWTRNVAATGMNDGRPEGSVNVVNSAECNKNQTSEGGSESRPYAWSHCIVGEGFTPSRCGLAPSGLRDSVEQGAFEGCVEFLRLRMSGVG